jgi:septum site-determining protein MinC
MLAFMEIWRVFKLRSVRGVSFFIDKELTMQAVESTVAPCFQLKGGMFTLTSIQLVTQDLTHLSLQLQEKIMQAPKFFCNAPVVIDLQKIGLEGIKVDFKYLKEVLREQKLFPVAVKGGTQQQQTAAVVAGLAVLPESRHELESKKMDSDPQTENDPTHAQADSKPAENAMRTPTRLITHPIRSGQQIYAQGGDLIIMAPVSHGAELLADGHIHVYGPLRGRALAGITGDTNAAIYCQSLEAELVSIAGQYRICEDLKTSPLWKQAAFVHLQQDRLHIDAL